MIVEINIDVPGSSSESPRNLSVFKRFRRIGQVRETTAELEQNVIFKNNIRLTLTSENSVTLDLICNAEVSVIDTVDIVKSDASHELGIRKNAVTHRFEEVCDDNERVTFFRINVCLEGQVWPVYRRYKEFDALRHITEIYVDKTRFRLPKFPPKSLTRLTGEALSKRMFSLNRYIAFLLDSGGFGSSNLIDVLMSFLEIPDHIGDDGQEFTGTSPTERESAYSRASLPARSTLSSPMRESMVYSSSRQQKKILSDLMVSAQGGAIRGGKSNQSGRRFDEESNTEIKEDWRSVISEVSAPDIGRQSGLSAASSSTSDARVGKSRLISGIAVLKHGRNRGTQNRVLKIDSSGQTLYWFDPKKGSTGHVDINKSISFSDVLKVQLGVKYIRGPQGDKECLPNCTAILSRSGCSIDRLRRCLSLIVPERTLDIECVSESDCSDLHAAFLDLTRPYSESS